MLTSSPSPTLHPVNPASVAAFHRSRACVQSRSPSRPFPHPSSSSSSSSFSSYRAGIASVSPPKSLQPPRTVGPPVTSDIASRPAYVESDISCRGGSGAAPAAAASPHISTHMIPSHSPSSGPAAAESAPIAPTNTTPLGKRRETSTSPRTTAQAQQSQTPATPAQPNPVPSASNTSVDREVASPKRLRAPQPALKVMPARYEDCNVKDLIVLISNMLMELVRYNDTIPLSNGGLTRFHSRAPPGISIPDYLARLTTHATLSPPILLSMVYYIDRLCALYPAFNISSLTVHRFLITAATVASKGLSDAFWTNNTYARVGGVSLRELALLELEFLWRVEWRIVPKPEVLVDYYRSLVQRSEGFTIEDAMETNGDAAAPEP